MLKASGSYIPPYRRPAKHNKKIRVIAIKMGKHCQIKQLTFFFCSLAVSSPHPYLSLCPTNETYGCRQSTHCLSASESKKLKWTTTRLQWWCCKQWHKCSCCGGLGTRLILLQEPFWCASRVFPSLEANCAYYTFAEANGVSKKRDGAGR